jgi:hypothetical protein
VLRIKASRLPTLIGLLFLLLTAGCASNQPDADTDKRGGFYGGINGGGVWP